LSKIAFRISQSGIPKIFLPLVNKRFIPMESSTPLSNTWGGRKRIGAVDQSHD
jgi:hypothetical protein